MDQSLALNALAPYLALAKSATSPRAAADLITQATSAPNTYVFAELLQQPNVQALQGNEQFGGSFELLKIFAWGTWEDYKATSTLPTLSDAQTLKLRLLSLLTIASSKTSSTDLTYSSLASRLGLSSPIDLEHLITQAIYSNLLTATLNPAAQTVVITSVSPLRDLAPGSIATMTAELAAWSQRCDSVLSELEAEIARVRASAATRRKEEVRVEKQVKGVLEAEKGAGQGVLGRATRGALGSRGPDDDDDDEMEIDGGPMGGKRKGGAAGGLGSMLGRFSGRSGGR